MQVVSLEGDPRKQEAAERREALVSVLLGPPEQLLTDSGVVYLRTGMLGCFPQSLSHWLRVTPGT